MKKEDKGKLSKVDISVKYICNQLTDPFFVSDANFNIIYANDSFKKMIGKKPIGKKCYKLIHELDKFVKGGAYETAVKTKKAAIIELFEPRLKKWLMIVATPVPKKGKLIVCTQHIKDITEKKEAERESEMLSSVVRQSIEGMAVADLKGNIIFSNEAWSRMHGYKSPEELLGKNLAIFHNKEQLKKEVKPFNKKVIALGAFSGEVWHIRKDGKPFPTLMSTALLKDGQGRPYAIAGIAMDITERKKAEEYLRESEEKFRSLFENSPVIKATLDERWSLIDINKKAEEVTGYKKEELIGKNVTQMPIFSKKTIAIMHDNFVRRMKGEDIKPYEIEFNDKKGNLHYGTLYGSTMHSSSENRNYALIVITEETDNIKMKKELAVHLKELETFKRFAVNRELKMIELKNRIKGLEKKAKACEK